MAPSRFILICLLVHLCFGDFGRFIQAEEVTYNWEVKYMIGAPDCMEKKNIMGINGQFPGPTIKARAGDNVVVNLKNQLLHHEGVVIHWHGIRQKDTPWADGTAFISQCPIEFEKTFTYNFTVDKAGTYFYHGHLGMQRSAGLYGMLIVDVAKGMKEPFEYDGEFSLLLSDWWHRGIKEQEEDLNAAPVRWIGEAQSVLINGKGQFSCTLEPDRGDVKYPRPRCKPSDVEMCAPYILNVERGKTYRLRVASTTALAALNIAIESHTMFMVEADGNYIQRFQVKDFDIYSGESYSVILQPDNYYSASISYWITVGVRGRDPTTTARGLTILNYNPNKVFTRPYYPPRETHRWDDYDYSKSFSNKIFALEEYSSKPPEKYDHRIILLNTQNTFQGRTKWAVNNVSLNLTETPYLKSIKYNIDNAYDKNSPPLTYPDTYDITKPPPNPECTISSAVYNLEYGKTYDVILQNANMLKHDSGEIHPWHLHGHDFWVLGYGEGMFSTEDEKKFNLKNPPLRNTAVVYPGGWTALRFETDNAGVWAFHCHIEPHLHMGMGVIFAEGVHSVHNIPEDAISCGLPLKKPMIQNHN